MEEEREEDDEEGEDDNEEDEDDVEDAPPATVDELVLANTVAIGVDGMKPFLGLKSPSLPLS